MDLRLPYLLLIRIPCLLQAHAMSQHLGAGSGECFEVGISHTCSGLQPPKAQQPSAGRVAPRTISGKRTHHQRERLGGVARMGWDPAPVHAARRWTVPEGPAAQLLERPECSGLTEGLSASGEGLTPEQIVEIGKSLERVREWRDSSDIREQNAAALRRLDDVLSQT